MPFTPARGLVIPPSISEPEGCRYPSPAGTCVISPSPRPDAGKERSTLIARDLSFRGVAADPRISTGADFIRKSLMDLNFVPAAAHNAVRRVFTVGLVWNPLNKRLLARLLPFR